MLHKLLIKVILLDFVLLWKKVDESHSYTFICYPFPEAVFNLQLLGIQLVYNISYSMQKAKSGVTWNLWWHL